MGEFRTKKTHDEYIKYIAEGNLENGCNLCKALPIKEFEYWKIMDNLFPWDLVAKTNHIILPKRHAVYEKLTEEERKEFDLIKSEYIEKGYEFIVESTIKRKSIPTHFHKHLLILKDEI